MKKMILAILFLAFAFPPFIFSKQAQTTAIVIHKEVRPFVYREKRPYLRPHIIKKKTENRIMQHGADKK
jgi:hypothetical protein